MKFNLAQLRDKTPAFLRNKYVLSLVLFVIWILIFDPNNIARRVTGWSTIKKLETEKQFYIDKIKEDSIELNQLRTDNEKLEKYAREHYKMKKENEDVYVIIDETENKQE